MCRHDKGWTQDKSTGIMTCVLCGKVMFPGFATDSPPVFSAFFRQVAPLVEAEKVLIDWLEKQGIGYADGANSLGWGYWVQRTDGVDPRRGEPPFSTYAQCLAWCLEFARQTIQTGEHARTMGATIDEFCTELARLGVDPDIFIQATANMAQRRVDNLNNAK